MSRNVSFSMVQSFTENDTSDIVEALRKVVVYYRR